MGLRLEVLGKPAPLTVLSTVGVSETKLLAASLFRNSPFVLVYTLYTTYALRDVPGRVSFPDEVGLSPQLFASPLSLSEYRSQPVLCRVADRGRLPLFTENPRRGVLGNPYRGSCILIQCDRGKAYFLARPQSY